MIEAKGLIEPNVFKEFVAAGTLNGVSIRFVDQGLVILVRVGSTERVLGQYRGGPRFFQSFDGAAALLQKNGVLTWDADTTDWIPRTAPQKSDKE
jgi:hypothetical protein